MAPSRLLFFLRPIFINLVALTMVQSQNYHLCLNDHGNYTTNSTYQANLKNLLASVSSTNDTNYGFYNKSSGQNPDKVNAIALCRGDIKPDSCRSCINNSTRDLIQLCPNQKEAIIWYDNCTLRYSNRSIFGKMELGPYFFMYNLNNVTMVNQFNQVLDTLLNNLTTRAASGDSLLKFATGNATTPNNQTIFALAQCTPDLSEMDCRDCLTKATELHGECCNNREGGRVIGTSCNYRYEKDIFYDPAANALAPATAPAPAPLPPPPPPSPPPPPAGTGAEVTSPLSPSTNTATRKGKENSTFQTAISILVSVFFLQYLASVHKS